VVFVVGIWFRRSVTVAVLASLCAFWLAWSALTTYSGPVWLVLYVGAGVISAMAARELKAMRSAR
jgi:D-arabinose 1-dehydrogenase-like Zn-dependent alcohol dehydrogenase